MIEAFAACAGARGRAQLVQGRSQLDIAVEALPDPAVRAMFRQVVVENKLYKSQNDQLRSAFKELSVKRPAVAMSSQPRLPELAAHVVESLTDREKELLKRNLSPERFEENGWTLLDGGGVVDDAGVVILSPGFMETMGKLLT